MLWNTPDHNRGSGGEPGRGFCLFWETQQIRTHQTPCLEARLYLSQLYKMKRGETEVEVDRDEENFSLFSVVMVQHARIHVGMCSLALPGVSWPSISCSQTTKSQLMPSFRVTQTTETLTNVIVGRKEQQQRSSTAAPEHLGMSHTEYWSKFHTQVIFWWT